MIVYNGAIGVWKLELTETGKNLKGVYMGLYWVGSDVLLDLYMGASRVMC